MRELRKIRPLKITQQRVRVIIASDWYEFSAHWDRTAGQSRECAGAGCFFCGDQSKPHPLYYAVGEDHHRTLWLVCLRRRHSELVHHLRASRGDGVGPELELWKSGSAPNSPIRAEVVGEWDVESINADAFMQTVLLPGLTRKPPTLRAADPLKDRAAGPPQSGTSAL